MSFFIAPAPASAVLGVLAALVDHTVCNEISCFRVIGLRFISYYKLVSKFVSLRAQPYP